MAMLFVVNFLVQSEEVSAEVVSNLDVQEHGLDEKQIVFWKIL